MSRTVPLYALQQTDNEISARQHRLSEIKAQLGETEELLAARQRLETVKQVLANWRTEQRDLDLKLQSLQQKIRTSEQKLYSGKIRNPKELSDLQEEIASLNRRRTVVEDELLELMMQIEEGEAEKQEASDWLQQKEGEWTGAQANLTAEQASQEERLAELEAQRQNQIAKIPPADLENYEYIRHRKGGQAVALLQGSECQGCMTSLPLSVIKQARGGGIAHCGTCGRIMHLG